MQTVLNLKNDQQVNYVNELVLSYKKKESFKDNNFLQLNNSKKMSKLFRLIWNDEIEVRESFYLLCLNSKLDVVGFRKIADGGLSSVMVDIRLIFSTALLANSHSIVVAHNHPAGTLKPSHEDIALTNNILEASKVLSIKLLDHIILTADDYYSFADNGDL